MTKRKARTGGPPPIEISRAAPRTASSRSRIPSQSIARDFSRRLRAWFHQHGRDLPWRRTRDPWAVLVSELMLQQTQVRRVLDFYPRFLSRFPTLHDLARARPRDVVHAWQGLGYYARARNLHRLATQVVREGSGALPRESANLRALPGIGPYTAGAVSSFAYEQPAALVDTNVARVLARIFAPSLRAGRARDHRRLWQLAEAVLPARGREAWVHNQALMELGALVCTARVRHCARCPVRSRCATFARDNARSQTKNRSG